MPSIPPGVADQATRSAFAILANEPLLSTSALSSRLFEIWGYKVEGSDAKTFSRIASAAARQIVAASASMGEPSIALPAARIPVRPGMLPDEPRFIYRVLVTAHNRQTGERFSTAVDVRSDELLTAEQAQSIAEQSTPVSKIRDSNPNLAYTAGQEYAITSEVVAIGKAS